MFGEPYSENEKWPTEPFGELTNSFNNTRKPVKEGDRRNMQGPYPYYGATGIVDYVNDYKLDGTYLLISEDGKALEFRNYDIAFIATGKIWVNNHAHVVQSKGKVSLEYLQYYFKYLDISDWVSGIDQKKLNRANLDIIPIMVPPAELITQFDEFVCQSDKSKFIGFKSQFIEMFGDPVDNPRGWETKGLLELGKCKNGMNFSAGESGVNVHCLGVGDFKDYSEICDTSVLPKISLNKMPPEEVMLQDGDIVFVRSNGNKMLVGRCLVIFPGDIPTTYSGFCIRFRKEAECVDTTYLVQLLKADSTRSKMVGRGANIQNLNQQILGALQIPIPPIELQQEFKDFIKQSDKSK